MTEVREMNETSATDHVDVSTDRLRRDIADVRSLEDGDSLVVADPRVELTVTNVEGDDAAGAALQQAVRESTRRRTTVEDVEAR